MALDSKTLKHRNGNAGIQEETIKHVSLVECYSNHIITRISIQTAELAFGGTGLCSYRVDGSYAKHLTVESYTVVMLLTVKFLFRHPLTLSFQA